MMDPGLRIYLESTLKEVSIDCVIFGFHAGELKVLLLKWKGIDGWSLPGGRIYLEESVNEAAVRILQERTGLKEIFLQQFYTFGSNDRYKNMDVEALVKKLEWAFGSDFYDEKYIKRNVSLGYMALVEFEQVVATPDWYTDECMWCEISAVPKLLFDHNEMIEVALKALRRQLSYQPIGYNLLPEKFTMPELQRLYETILGKQLDRRNFQKLMLSYDILEKLPEKRTGGAFKAPFLYRFDKEKYDRAMQEEILFAV
ncbi:NrtR DNA-binding winged helix domain-containing protein [Emticicia sp. BO119]|uniref:NUDIX hydrolase n=1 Tax=Emticicia sp. BO119 TaxID=2757768 RepID=UPI00286D7C07|nr:NUDIX domain-containing protein [Emticicia sp. BO119]